MKLKVVVSFLLPVTLFICLIECSFAQSERQTAYAILLDNSGSLRSQFDRVQSLADGLVRHIHKLGPVSLFSFTTQGDQKHPTAMATLAVEWTQDDSLFYRTIDSLAIEKGDTRLFDAINSIAENIRAKAGREGISGKVLILITDGEDRKSQIKEKRLIEALKESGVKVYAIGLVQELDAEVGLSDKTPRERAVGFLKRITKETGGRVIFPKSDKVDVDDLLNELLADLSQQNAAIYKRLQLTAR